MLISKAERVSAFLGLESGSTVEGVWSLRALSSREVFYPEFYGQPMKRSQYRGNAMSLSKSRQNYSSSVLEELESL